MICSPHQKNIYAGLIIPALVLTMIQPLPARAKGQAKRPGGYALEQEHLIYGNVRSIVAPNGVRVICKGNDFEFSTNAPDWDFLLYSKKRKLLSVRPFSDWSKRGIKTCIAIANNETLYKWPRVLMRDNFPYAGKTCKLYAFPGKSSTGRPMSLKYGKFGEYIVCDRLSTHENVPRFMQALFDTPPDRGVPLSFKRFGQANSYGFGLNYNRKEASYSILKTNSIAPEKEPRTMLDMPRSAFKPALESEIVVNQSHFNDFFKEMQGAPEGIKKTSP